MRFQFLILEVNDDFWLEEFRQELTWHLRRLNTEEIVEESIYLDNRSGVHFNITVQYVQGLHFNIAVKF